MPERRINPYNRCSRCGRDCPEDAAAAGWTAFEDVDGNLLDYLCAGCHTADETVSGIPDTVPEEWV
jgi:hypothetical protein